MPSLQSLKDENDKRKAETVTTITPEEATSRKGFNSDGTRAKQYTHGEEAELNRKDRRGEGLLAALCGVM